LHAERDLALQDDLAGRRQIELFILRERGMRRHDGNQSGDIQPNARCHRGSS
jgi:hypothetical protein